MFVLSGFDATDFGFTSFYAGSQASGDEALANVGNDIFYGRQGRIESVRDTNRFGDSEADDLTAGISDAVANYTGWRIVYNGRLNRAYMFPAGISECWVYNIAMRPQANVLASLTGSQDPSTSKHLSPWMRWTTQHALAFQPTFVMEMLDPADGLEYIFMGDGAGNIYRMEGVGSGDGGTTKVKTEWLSRLYTAPLDTELFHIEGYVKYRKNQAFNLDMSFEYGGFELSTQGVSMTVPTTGIDAWYWGGAFGDPDTPYWSADIYWGASALNRLMRQRFDAAGQASDFQLRLIVDSSNNWAVNEIGMRFTVAS